MASANGKMSKQDKIPVCPSSMMFVNLLCRDIKMSLPSLIVFNEGSCITSYNIQANV